jgi:hypothetical protein
MSFVPRIAYRSTQPLNSSLLTKTRAQGEASSSAGLPQDANRPTGGEEP